MKTTLYLHPDAEDVGVTNYATHVSVDLGSELFDPKILLNTVAAADALVAAASVAADLLRQRADGAA